MGTYHLMGLGRSPGTVIGPLTYLAHRYQRWNEDDQRFFARSGEVRQREAGEKVGDIQALVLFTTREVLSGEVETLEYADNPPGRIAKSSPKYGGPMKEVLRKLLRREWPAISGGRREGSVFWCEVDRRDIRTTYERVVQVVAALAGVGGQGKEIWANLTGGNNVINAALELAAMLSGDVARLYYVQAENPDAEKCVRYTAENGYWIELPVMPLALGRLRRAIIDLLAEGGPLSLADLYSRLQNEYWDLSRGLTSEEVLRQCLLQPAWEPGDQPHYRDWRYKIWQQGAGYDSHVYTPKKLLEKAAYIHAKPVRAGLASRPEEYPWSSAVNYQGVAEGVGFGYPCPTPAYPVQITLCTEVLS